MSQRNAARTAPVVDDWLLAVAQKWAPSSRKADEDLAKRLGEEAYQEAKAAGLPEQQAQRCREIWGSPLVSEDDCILPSE